MTAVAAPPVWPFPTIEHLSANSLAKAQACPEQWRLHYLAGKRERTNANMIIGNLVDEAAKAAYRQKLESKTATQGDVDDAVEKKYAAEIKDAGGESNVGWGDTNYTAVRDLAIGLARSYHTDVYPRIDPVGVGETIRYEVPGLPVPIIGYLDVRTKDAVIDVKTAKAKPAKGEIQPGWQLQAMIYRAATGQRVDFHVGTKTITPAWWTPVEMPDLSLPAASDTALVDKLLGRRAQMLHAYLALYGAEGPWPDAIGREAFHGAACRKCPFRDTDCVWWKAAA